MVLRLRKFSGEIYMKKWFLFSASLMSFTQCLTAYMADDFEEENELDYEEVDEYMGYSLEEITQADQDYGRNSDQQRNKQKKDKENAKFAAGTVTAARPVLTDSYNIWLRGEALCWQAAEDNLYYAGHSFSDIAKTDLLRFTFDWNWGFRLGGGYNFSRDGWDLALIWTSITNHAHGSKKDPDHVPQVWTDPRAYKFQITGPTNAASGSWKVILDQIDLQLGRECYLGRYLTFRPKVGLRTVFIHQKLRSSVTETTATQFGDVVTILKNKFWGFGFTGGFDTDWKLGAGFSLFGSTDFSLLFGFFDVDEIGNIYVNSVLVDRWSTNSSFRSEKSIFDLEIGFKWFGSFCSDRCGLTLKAGYAYHLYINQNQWQQPTGFPPTVAYIPTSGDLGYQGVSLSAQFDF